MRGLLPGRRGLTLLEIAIVVAIVGLLAAIAGPRLADAAPHYRTKRAAKEFAAALMQCRHLSISQNVEYRVRLSSFDASLDTEGAHAGAYFIERGNAASGSTSWDILPWDMDGSGTRSEEGTVDIGTGSEEELYGVSIAQWATISGVSGDDIVFSPRGWLMNPVSDFGSDGYIRVTFVNKDARLRGETDEWDVLVSRGGMVRLESNVQDPIGNAAGTVDASEWGASAATGHSP